MLIIVNVPMGKTVRLLLWSGLVLVLTCSGKMAASILFSRNFIHGPIDRSGIAPLELLLKYFWFDPANTPLFIKFG